MCPLSLSEIPGNDVMVPFSFVKADVELVSVKADVELV